MHAHPISIDEFEKARADSENVKALVVVSSLPEENNASEWMADELTEELKAKGGVDVARYALPKLRVHACVGCYAGGGRVCMDPCDRNDIESDIYRADDGMLGLYDQIRQCDIFVLATDVRWAGLNHLTQRFLERLNPFVNMAAVGKPMLKKKTAGVVIAGDGSQALAGKVMATLNAVGFSFPRFAYAAWHIPRMASAETTQAAYQKSKEVHEDLRLLAEDLMDYAKLLRGE